MSGENQEQPLKTSNEAIKFVAWAIGIGAGSTFAIITYASAQYLSKESFQDKQAVTDQKIKSLDDKIGEIKTSNKELQDWLRKNWNKRSPED